MLEDLEDEALLVARELKATFSDVDLHRVDSRADFEAALDRDWDVVLSDYNIPGFGGMEALQLAKTAKPDLPFILVTGTIGEEAAVLALKEGVDDYVLKSNTTRLGPAIQRQLREVEERNARRRSEMALAESEERFRQLAENLDAIFYLTDLDNSEVFYLSPAYEKIFGRPVKEVYASPRSWRAAIHPDDKKEVTSCWAEGASGPVTRRYRIIRPDGAIRWIRVRAFPVLDRSGKPYRIAGIIEDETDRKAAEDRIARLNRVYAVLSEISAVMLRLPSRSELVEEACRIAVEAGRIRMAWLGLYDHQALAIRAVASHGHDAGFVDLLPLSLDDADYPRGLVRTAIGQKRPVIVNDISEEPRFRLKQEALARGYRSAAVLPLLVGDDIIGVFGLFAGEPHFFDDEEMRLLNALAGDISFALDHIAKSERLEYLAYYDALTGLSNRTFFLERLGQALPSALESRRKLALIVSDLERFRAVNDSLGRQAGDFLLARFAERLKECVLDSHQVARLGADQFAIVVPDVKSELEAAHVLHRIAEGCFGNPFHIGGTELRISAKAGIALFPSDGANAEALLRNAEAALKRAKRRGERHVFFEEGMTRRVAENLALENDLRRAIEREEFVLHYQPRIDTASRQIVGLEALIRWQRGDELVSPGRFIPLLEETGLILEAGAWALRQAIRQHKAWTEHNLAPPRIAVNVSAIQLRQRNFVSRLKRLLDEGAKPHGIDLEVTESRLMDDVTGNIAKLKELQDSGVRIAIDDFGTGYSSLAYLARLPVNSLKIDRSFVITMLSDANVMTLVRMIVSLAHELRLRVAAEGVDAEDQAAVLRALGCDEMQGYLFSKPLPADEMSSLLRRVPS